MSRFSATIILLLFPFQTNAQAAIPIEPCPHENAETVAELNERLTCVEQRVSDLREAQELLLQTQLNLRAALDEAAEKFDFEVFGPNKVVENFGFVKLAITHGYWDSGNQVRTHNCVPPLNQRSGMTLIGGALSEAVRITILNHSEYGAGGLRGCAPAPFCDSAGEFCTAQSRAKGCFVNTDWYDWYTRTQKQKGLTIDLAEVCAG